MCPDLRKRSRLGRRLHLAGHRLAAPLLSCRRDAGPICDVGRDTYEVRASGTLLHALPRSAHAYKHSDKAY
jgi:hypothetical protein